MQQGCGAKQTSFYSRDIEVSGFPTKRKFVTDFKMLLCSARGGSFH